MDEKIIQEIKIRAQYFVNENIKKPKEADYLFTEQAMLIGASIVFEKQAENS